MYAYTLCVYIYIYIYTQHLVLGITSESTVAIWCQPDSVMTSDGRDNTLWTAHSPRERERESRELPWRRRREGSHARAEADHRPPATHEATPVGFSRGKAGAATPKSVCIDLPTEPNLAGRRVRTTPDALREAAVAPRMGVPQREASRHSIVGHNAAENHWSMFSAFSPHR